MAEKLKFKLQSNPCLDPQGTVHAMVDIKLNDVIVAEDVQLDATIQTLTYDADITDNANNTISIQVTNAIAEDLNDDGRFPATTKVPQLTGQGLNTQWMTVLTGQYYYHKVK